MNIPDHISESLETIFGLQIFQFFNADTDTGSGIFLTLDPGAGMEKFRSGIWDDQPGSATPGKPYVLHEIRESLLNFRGKACSKSQEI
jgi:hypothetical protein